MEELTNLAYRKMKSKRYLFLFKVQLTRHSFSYKDHYGGLCFTLSDSNSTKLDEKCTTGNGGEPFLIKDKNLLEVNFQKVDKVKTVAISFKNGDPAIVADLKIFGLQEKGYKDTRF